MHVFFGKSRLMPFKPHVDLSHPETIFTLANGDIETYDIGGVLGKAWLTSNGFLSGSTWLKRIVEVDVGNTVTSIGPEAFMNNTTLTTFNMPDSVSSIGSKAFQSCALLASIKIPNTVTCIQTYSFASCGKLKTIMFGNSVETIEDRAFINCIGLDGAIDLPNSVFSIGASVFWGCRNFQSLTIPDSVLSIGTSAFSDTEKLTTVTIVSNNGNAAAVQQKLTSAGATHVTTWNIPS